MRKNNEIDEFYKEMKDVRPFSQDKIKTTSNSKKNQLSINHRRKAAQSAGQKYENFLTNGEIDLVKPLDVISFKIDGLQPNVFKNLKKAKYKFDYHLDLHGMSVEQARQIIYKLISSAKVEDFRCLLVTHGKGQFSAVPAKLKSYVNHWLRQIEQVLAFHSALPQHGGVGSVYVLLKKPKEERKINQVKYD